MNTYPSQYYVCSSNQVMIDQRNENGFQRVILTDKQLLNALKKLKVLK